MWIDNLDSSVGSKQPDLGPRQSTQATKHTASHASQPASQPASAVEGTSRVDHCLESKNLLEHTDTHTRTRSVCVCVRVCAILLALALIASDFLNHSRLGVASVSSDWLKTGTWSLSLSILGPPRSFFFRIYLLERKRQQQNSTTRDQSQDGAIWARIGEREMRWESFSCSTRLAATHRKATTTRARAFAVRVGRCMFQKEGL